ncbi:2-keto-3-deoxygluconate kinase [Asanoa ferruginea]|uniref:2-keto-3-deoxygluconate kinase n=1 Tax=Asanoa ferruginea TaxID=53367 RepID=A0A3D9ZMK0_9ACTN|nr:sugar kinase [Asanoa ferruginea]REF98447.1 2-keto-3-deoxygluconate kinase [Asanoa ferruginea]GIF52386.1 2-dehydro-3-deoxygluconokinase [Asanoa ferruginea]
MDIIAIGEPLLEFSTVGQETLDNPGQFSTGFGGDTSNFLVAAARSGARTGYLTRIGADPFGEAFLRLWQAEGIDTRHVVRAEGERTGVYFISRHPASSVFTYYRADSAASRLAPADVPEASVAAARALHVSGITQAISLSACDAAFHAMTIARAAGTLVSYDPNYRPQLWPLDRARAVVTRSIELADVAFPNIEEGRLLTGAQDPRAVVDWFAARGPRTVVLKMGADGALLWHEGTLTEIKPHPVVPIDSTGAGDAFDGAFMAHLVSGATPAEAAHYAAVAGALTTQGHGAVGPVPTRATILAAG